MIRKLAVALIAATTLLVSSAAAASAAPARQDFRAQARASGLTASEAVSLQQRVDAVLAAIPGGRQVSATEIRYDGLTVTFDLKSPADLKSAASKTMAAVSCSYGWFCIRSTNTGTTYTFYTCQYWALTDWWGTWPYTNNQTTGTIAKFYDQNYNELWRSKAYDAGTVNVTPFWIFKPC